MNHNSLAVLLAACTAAQAEPSFSTAPVLGHGMVLQRGVEVPISGTALPATAVSVLFAWKTAEAVADAKGAWCVRLPPLEASAEPRELRFVVAGADPQTVFTNVVVGDVWLCSGQSNMAGFLGNHREAREDNDPLLRQFTSASRNQAGAELGGRWELATPQGRSTFTATGYFFGRALRRELGVPIGILKQAVSGSLIEPWIPRETLLGDPAVADIVKASPATARPGPEAPGVHVYANDAGRRFSSFIRPLIPYAIRGFVWYQGEANARIAATSKPYGQLLTLLVRSWREAWGAGDLPFYFVQLPSIADPERTYYLVREQMLQTLGTLPNLGMAVTIDINEGLHPPSKHIVGERLALLALRGAYGKDVVANGPLFQAAEFADGKAICRFAEIGGGLTAKGDTLGAFELSGEDRVFHPATAAIDGDTVVVSSPGVPNPVAVRYAWGNAVPNASLFNRAGLPASPFRSDRW